MLKYEDLSPTRELAGANTCRVRTSVGDIMSGGDLIRHSTAGELLRSRELLAVDELFPTTRLSPVLTMPRGSRDPPSPVREIASRRILETDILASENLGDFETYRPLGGSPRMTQHLLSGRDSIL